MISPTRYLDLFLFEAQEKRVLYGVTGGFKVSFIEEPFYIAAKIAQFSLHFFQWIFAPVILPFSSRRCSTYMKQEVNATIFSVVSVVRSFFHILAPWKVEEKSLEIDRDLAKRICEESSESMPEIFEKDSKVFEPPPEIAETDLEFSLLREVPKAFFDAISLVGKVFFKAAAVVLTYEISNCIPPSNICLGAFCVLKGSSFLVVSKLPEKVVAISRNFFLKEPQKDHPSCDYKLALYGTFFLGLGITLIHDAVMHFLYSDGSYQPSRPSSYERIAAKNHGEESLRFSPSDPRGKVLVLSAGGNNDWNGALNPKKGEIGQISQYYDIRYRTVNVHPNEVCRTLQETAEAGIDLESVVIRGHGSPEDMILGRAMVRPREDVNFLTTSFQEGCFDSLKEDTPINLVSCSTGEHKSSGFAYGLSREYPNLQFVAATEPASPYHTTFNQQNRQIEMTNRDGASITRVFKNGNLIAEP